MMKRSINVMLASVGLLATMAACGGGSSSGQSSTGSSSRPATSGMPAASSTPATGSSAGGSAVEIRMFTFSPKTLTVASGTTVTWTNRDEILHTVVAGSGPENRSDAFSGDLADAGATFSFTFDQPGTYEYFCDRHAAVDAMHGTIVVT